MIHFWSLCIDNAIASESKPEPVRCLEQAFRETDDALRRTCHAVGSTTSSTAVLYCEEGSPATPLIAVTTLGDSKIMVIRPSEETIVYSSREQWAYFNCPIQLGTGNVPRDAREARLDIVELRPNDIVLALSDGVTDNLWQHEILEIVMEALQKHEAERATSELTSADDSLVYAARRLLAVARSIALDPEADSPFMEGMLASGKLWQGGKFDDISVVIARCESLGNQKDE